MGRRLYVGNLPYSTSEDQLTELFSRAGSLARILGPIFATGLLPFMPPLPYLICTGILLGTSFILAQRFRGERAAAAVPPAGEVANP